MASKAEIKTISHVYYYTKEGAKMSCHGKLSPTSEWKRDLTRWLKEDGGISTFELAVGEYPIFMRDRDLTFECNRTTDIVVLALYLLDEFELIPETTVEPLTEPRRIKVTLESRPPIIPGRRTIVDILDSKNKTLKSYTLEDHTNEPLIYYVDIIAAEKYFVNVSVNYTEDVVATKLLRDETQEMSRSEGMKSVELPAVGILNIKEFPRIDNWINISYKTTDFVEGDNLTTYFEISTELLRPLRTEVYPYVVEKFEVPNYDGRSRVYSMNGSYFVGSIYDKMNITITPQVGDYKGSSTDLLVALHLPSDAVKPLTRRVGKFEAVMPLECAEFVPGESECFWEMLIKDDVEKPLTLPRKFHNGTEIPELRTIEVFLDESYTNKATLFFCYVKRSTKYDVHKWTTAIEVVPILSHQLKPKLTVDVVEQRPRHLVIKWSLDDPPANISGIRISVGIFDGIGKYKELESGNKTTGSLDYKLGNERQELNVEVAVNFTEDHGIFDRSEQKKVIEAIEELRVVDLERIESSEKDATQVTLMWKTKGARSFEEKELEYEIRVEIWQRSWKTYSTITHKPKVSATQTYALDSGPVGAISSKLRISVTPKIGSFLGTSDAIELTLKTDLKTDVRVVKFGTTVKLNCSEYKSEGSSYWERQEDGKGEMKLAVKDAESLTVLASNGQLYYACYVENVGFYKKTTAIYIFAVEGPPPAPQFDFRLIRSKPYKLHLDWKVDWREDIPTRRLNVTVKQGDDIKVEVEEIMEKEGTVSTDISADISTDISADIAKITVLANATYGENLLRTVEKTINIKHITLVNFGISDDDIDTIKIKWNVLGVLPNDKPQYKIKIECGEDYKEEKMVKQNSIVIAIKRRPYRCDLFAQAILDSYEGPVAKYQVKLKAKSPEEAPTNVKFTHEGLTTTITFDRIPAEVMQKFGESQGCQVFVCKEKKASRKCFNKTTSPEAGEVKFENLEEYAIFHVAVSCRTTGGSGPLSDWITMPIPGNSTARIEAAGWLNLIVTWTLQSRNGSRLRTDYVKSVLIRRFKQDKDGTWTGGEVVSENLAGRINVGLSPGFKFDTNCYIYTINITLVNGGTVNGRSEEMCYSMLSPSFVMLYLVILVALVLVVLKIYQTKPKKGKHRPKRGRKKKKGKEKKKSKSVTKTKGPSKPSTSKSGSVDEMKMSGMSGVSGSRDDVKKPLK